MFDIAFVYVFTVGMAAAFNPCGAAMFPAYVGYQLGTVEADERPVATTLRGVLMGLAATALRGVLMGLAATAGFIVVFGVAGVVLAAGGPGHPGRASLRGPWDRHPDRGRRVVAAHIAAAHRNHGRQPRSISVRAAVCGTSSCSG